MPKNQAEIFNIKNGKDRPLIIMSGYIGGWKVNSESLFNAINKMQEDGVTDCDVLINSGGGSTVEGLTIGEYIQASPINFHATVTGMAASMAGVILQFCDTRASYKYARIMTHKVMGFVGGESAQIRAYADLVDQEEEKIVDKFMERTKKSKETIASWMKSGVNTWFNATKAKENNLIDTIIDTNKKAPSITENATEEEIVNSFGAVLNSICEEYMDEPKPASTNSNTNIEMKTRIIAMLGSAGIQNSLTVNSSDDAILSALEDVFQSARNENIAKDELIKFKKEQGQAIVNAAAKAGKIGPNEVDEWVENYIENPKAIATALSRMTGKPDPANGLQPSPKDPSAEGQPEALKGREDWDHDKWMAEDPKGYEKLQTEHPEAFDKIFNAKFNHED